MRIVQLANFHAPTSGGIRVALEAIGAGYRRTGHDRVLIVPGRRRGRRDDLGGAVLQVPGVRLRGTPYRCIVDRRPLLSLLERLEPDVVEVSDKLTLRWVGGWARRAGVPSMLFSHERIDAALAPHLPSVTPLGSIADRWNRHWADEFDSVACCSRFAAQEYARIGVEPTLVPLGVDLWRFRPRALTDSDGPTRLVVVARLSPEKEVDRVIEAVRVLRSRGRSVRLDIAGSGPSERSLRRIASGLPVVFLGHLPGHDVAELLAAAEVAIAPGPAETFGLAALEALASGTPVVARDRGACRELLTPEIGATASGDPDRIADAIEAVADRPRAETSAAARRHAERYDWSATVTGLLAVHEAGAGRVALTA
ncbi:MAG: glycosyltransferase [Actinomycetota bacterium]